MITLLLAWRPFIDPINFDRFWYLILFPMVLFLAIGYKSVRTVDMTKYWRQVFTFSTQLLLGLLILGTGFFFVIRGLLPMIAPIDR